MKWQNISYFLHIFVNFSDTWKIWDKRFSWGCFWKDEWNGFEISDLTVDLWGDRPKPLFQEANVMCFVCLSMRDSG